MMMLEKFGSRLVILLASALISNVFAVEKPNSNIQQIVAQVREAL